MVRSIERKGRLAGVVSDQGGGSPAVARLSGLVDVAVTGSDDRHEQSVSVVAAHWKFGGAGDSPKHETGMNPAHPFELRELTQ